ncbi:hypothetical protein TcCL_NonESM10567 [Trypanosoma cruzi]|nr:hypothetical protein TcCL_NonESM10567 [Trypanosoma cruzi]
MPGRCSSCNADLRKREKATLWWQKIRSLRLFVPPALSFARSLTAGCNAATWYCLGSCASFTASGLLCGRTIWLQERCQWPFYFFAGILPLCMVVVWGCVGGGRAMVSLA